MAVTEARRRQAQIVKHQVLSHYSNGTLKCAWCKEDDLVVLCLDHILGDGARKRRKSRVTGTHLYYRLRKEGYPEGYQVLCCNCNVRKQFVELNYLGMGK